jgi:hypothetical protein
MTATKIRMLMTRTTAFLIGLLAAALLAAGCGDQQAAIADKAREQAAENDANAGAETGNGEGNGGGTAAPAPRAPSSYTLPAGTVMLGTLQNTIDTGKNDEGDPVRLRLTSSERVGGVVVVPAGSTVRGTCTYVDGAGRVAGGAKLTIRWTDLVLTDGRSYNISSVPLRLEGKGDAKESAIEIGGGAVLGGVLGGIIGGKDDIGKGAAAGAVFGTGVAVATKGDQIVLPVGQKIQVTLDEPVRVTRSGA